MGMMTFNRMRKKISDEKELKEVKKPETRKKKKVVKDG